MYRIAISSKNVPLLLGICVYFIGKSIVGGELASEPTEFRIGVWSLQFTNRVNQVTNADITNIVGISSDLMVTLQDGIAGVNIEGVVVSVKSGHQTTCDVVIDNHTTRYKLFCIEQQPPFATVTLSVLEDINKDKGKCFAVEGKWIGTDGQLNLLPVPVDSQNKTDSCRFIAVVKERKPVGAKKSSEEESGTYSGQGHSVTENNAKKEAGKEGSPKEKPGIKEESK